MSAPNRPQTSVLTAQRAGVVGCQHCGKVSPAQTTICPRCGGAIILPTTATLQKVWAWLFAGLVMYVPANVLPMLVTSTINGTQANTILGGVVELALHGDIGVALIVFVASIVIPVAKFVAIAYLALAVGTKRRAGGHRHLVLYEIVEFIGRWSMIDVFVVAILSALATGELRDACGKGDAAMVARAQGVGPKLAGRIVNELKDKAGAMPGGSGGFAVGVAAAPAGSKGADAASALENLGFKPAVAAQAVARALEELGEGASEGDLIRVALKKAAS